MVGKYDIWTKFKHFFGHAWKREWAGSLEWKAPGDLYSWATHFAWVDRCQVCGEVRALYTDIIGRAHEVDMDQLIVENEGDVPYRVGSHEYLTPESSGK